VRRLLALSDVPSESPRYSSLSLLAERDYPFCLLDGMLRKGIRIVQESLRSACMRSYTQVIARHPRLEGPAR
jgi:hypothetical protein